MTDEIFVVLAVDGSDVALRLAGVTGMRLVVKAGASGRLSSSAGTTERATTERAVAVRFIFFGKRVLGVGDRDADEQVLGSWCSEHGYGYGYEQISEH